jgi:pimeloyl-ACP methyl ester carboxylesterase
MTPGIFRAPERTWPQDVAALQREAVRRLRDLLGEPPFDAPPPLNVQVIESHDDGDLLRHKLRYGNDSDDVVWAWLFVPRSLRAPTPAVICLAGSFMTPNWAKDAPAGLAGPLVPGDPEAYGRDLARLGFVTLCPDYPCCGERTAPGRRSHDTTDLDARFPQWSRVGLSAWDVSRAVDVLCRRDDVRPDRVAVCGWSQGGQMALIGAALDERIAAVVSVCGWGPWRGVGGERAANWARSYNFPRLAACLDSGEPLPLDFDDIAACVAPRPLLDVRAAADGTFPNRQEHVAALGALQRVWESCGHGERFRAVEVPGEHAHSTAAAWEERDWLRRWLR